MKKKPDCSVSSFCTAIAQQQLILYQIEMVAVPIDQNKQVHSYTHLQVDRPYIALNSETHFFEASGTENMKEYWL